MAETKNIAGDMKAAVDALKNPVVGDQHEETVELTEVEEQALENGWQTEDDFKADKKNSGKKWRPAEEFMDRKSLFDKIEEQHKQIRDLKKGVESLTKHNQNIEQSTYDRARKELQAEREKALDDGDIAKAEKLRDRIDEVKEQQKQAAPTTGVQQAGVELPEFTQFKQANPWYLKNVKMTAWADGMGVMLHRQGHGPEEVLRQVSQLAREEFPEQFNKRNPNKDDAPDVGKGKQSRATPDGFRLTDQESEVMKKMIRAGAKITEADYIAQIKRSKGF